MVAKPTTGPPDRGRTPLESLAELVRQGAALAGPPAAVPDVPGTDALIRYAEQISALPGLVVEPLRRLVEEQRELAEQLATAAERLRQLAEDGTALVDPLLSCAERTAELSRSWTGLLRPRDAP